MMQAYYAFRVSPLFFSSSVSIMSQGYIKQSGLLLANSDSISL